MWLKRFMRRFSVRVDVTLPKVSITSNMNQDLILRRNKMSTLQENGAKTSNCGSLLLH